jgi:hypothetical protein
MSGQTEIVRSVEAFHIKYGLSMESSQLRGNSFNAMYCICNNKYVVKVQLDPDADTICNDIYMHLYLSDLLRELKGLPASAREHFMQFIGYFPASIMQMHDPVNRSISYHYAPNGDMGINVSNMDTALRTRPCAVVAAVANHRDMLDMIEGCFSSERAAEYGPMKPAIAYKLSKFVKAFLDVGMETGMGHNDLHLGNVLYSLDAQEFVAIDFGRMHITMHPKFQNPLYAREIMNTFKPLLDDEERLWIGPMTAYLNDPFACTPAGPAKLCKEYQYEPRSGMSDGLYNGMYALCDLATMSYIVASIMPLKYAMKIISSNMQVDGDYVVALAPILESGSNAFIRSVVVQACNQGSDILRTFLQKLYGTLLFPLVPGILWRHLLWNIAQNDPEVQHMFIINKGYFLVCPLFMHTYKKQAEQAYIGHMKPLLGVWASVHMERSNAIEIEVDPKRAVQASTSLNAAPQRQPWGWGAQPERPRRGGASRVSPIKPKKALHVRAGGSPSNALDGLHGIPPSRTPPPRKNEYIANLLDYMEGKPTPRDPRNVDDENDIVKNKEIVDSVVYMGKTLTARDPEGILESKLKAEAGRGDGPHERNSNYIITPTTGGGSSTTTTRSTTTRSTTTRSSAGTPKYTKMKGRKKHVCKDGVARVLYKRGPYRYVKVRTPIGQYAYVRV